MALETKGYDVMERMRSMVEGYEARTGRSFWSDLRDGLRESGARPFYAGFFGRLLDGEEGREAV